MEYAVAVFILGAMIASLSLIDAHYARKRVLVLARRAEPTTDQLLAYRASLQASLRKDPTF
jgi:hypothetical protein